MKLSIIIPIYNTGKFLCKCVNSCLCQDIPTQDYEIILINDGSNDDSYSIARDIVNKSKNISLYSHDNCGLSETRNRGMELAKGDYIWFVDSDDWIRENCLNSILNQCYEKDLDAFQISACNVYGTVEERIYDVKENTISTGLQILDTDGFYVCAPFTIYKRSFLLEHKLKFYSRIFHEDCEFSPRSYFYLKRVAGTNEIIYYVYNNVNSITHTINPKRFYDLLFVIKRIDEFSSSFDRDIKRIYSNQISCFINLLLRFGNQLPNEEEPKLKQVIFENRRLFRHYIESCVSKYMIEGILFTILPKQSLSLFRLFQRN